ncbi:hypothetical protein [Pandoraea sputorum]|uniref:Lipoprotein n=1 Tax=Pandoraea sputorum TaxID=93222 RepID=A0A5E5BEZ5_9BURK|nr:hypothetical protein [Pandoraea sputorum]VVE84469.1 hypothetical protein PSP31121_04778 [Pandoraea sputorum]
MIRWVPVVAVLAFLGGCATSSQTFAPDGRPAYSINCSGYDRNWGMCFEKAGELCGSAGYDVYDRTAESGWVSGATASANPSGATRSAYAGSTTARSILVACKRPGR